MKHELKRERAGKAEMGSITPTCSCGWRGRTEYAYNDYCHTNVKEQEGDHIRNAHRGELETANATLEQQMMDACAPKNEREWWAFAEIGRLRADVEALRADAERWRYINERNGEWRRFEADGPDPAYSMLCVRLPYDADLSCRATREIAIDAARAAQGEKS